MSNVTATTGRSNYATEVRVGKHSGMFDEPAGSGGQDVGPSPTELLVGALAACTSITLRMYAERKGWELGTIQVTATPTRAADKTLSIDRVLSFEGQLSEEQRGRLAEIAERTPVTLALKSGVKIHTRLG